MPAQQVENKDITKPAEKDKIENKIDNKIESKAEAVANGNGDRAILDTNLDHRETFGNYDEKYDTTK